MNDEINALDIVVVVIYFLGVLGTGFWSMYKSNQGTVKGYFLAGQMMMWFPVGASLFASNIGSEHFIGLAGSGAAKGLGVGAFELNAAFLLQLLGWVFLPVYISSGAYTLPDYMHKRFGGRRIRCYLAIISLLLYIFTKISVNLYSASLFIYEALELNLWISVFILLIITGIITITGGLTAVLYTDTLQCILMVIGSIMLAVISFIKVGGIWGLYENYGKAVASIDLTNHSMIFNSTLLDCYLPSKKSFQMLRSIDDDDMPWLGFLFGQTPASIWYWCTDQMMVQRAMAATNIMHAKGGTLFAGVIKLLPLFVMVMPGMISRILYPDEVACATAADCLRVCGQESGCSNLAYPKLVMNLLPQGLRGLMLSVMVAALVTDLTSIFNSASTLFTVDIYSLIRKSSSEKELVIVGRLFVIVMIGLSLLWLPVIQSMQGGQLFIYIQAISGYLSPPIAAVFLMAIFWPRGNEKGAMSALVYGLVIGATKMIMDIVWRERPCPYVDDRPIFIRKFHYMYFALFSFLSCILIMVIVSLFTKKPSSEQRRNNTFYSYWRRRIEKVPWSQTCYSVSANIAELEFVSQETKEKEATNKDKIKSEKKKKIHIYSKFWNLFLGMEGSTKKENIRELTEKEKDMWLYEEKRIRIVLLSLVVILFTFVVTIFLLFSLSKIEIEVGPLRFRNDTPLLINSTHL